MPNGQRWTAAEDAALKKLYGLKIPLSEVAVKLTKQFKRPFTKNMVCGRINNAGMRATPPKRREVKFHTYQAKQYFSENPMQCRYLSGDGLDKCQCSELIFRRAYCQLHYLLCHDVGASGKEPPP
jgi:hypothetical protein